MIEQMRLDFPLAAKQEDWSAEEQADIGAAIRAAIETNDSEALAYWSQQLAASAAAWRAWCARVREAEARMRDAAQKARIG